MSKSSSRKPVPSPGASLWGLRPQVKPLGVQVAVTAPLFLGEDDDEAPPVQSPEGVFHPPVNWVSDTPEDL